MGSAGMEWTTISKTVKSMHGMKWAGKGEGPTVRWHLRHYHLLTVTKGEEECFVRRVNVFKLKP